MVRLFKKGLEMDRVCPIRLNCLTGADRLGLKETGPIGQYDILDRETGNILGRVFHPGGDDCTVELFWGKGGFMAMLTSPSGLRYCALPGSSVEVLGVRLVLEGRRITGNPAKKPRLSETVAVSPQRETDQAMILGAGLATRFERISGDSTQYSKPAVPLSGNRSVIACIADQLALHGFNRLIVNTFFKPESLKDGLSRTEGRRADYHVDYIDEAQPSGTAGGLRKMLVNPRYAPLLDTEKPLLVVQGDAVTDADFSALAMAHQRHGALLTIGCQEVEERDVSHFGIVVTDRSGEDGQSGRITGFQEKPGREEALSRLANTGFYLFSPKAYPMIREIYEALLARAQETARAEGAPVPEEVSFDFAMDLFPEILRRTQAEPTLGDFRAQIVQGYWSDIGNPVQYLETLHDLYEGKVGIPLPAQKDHYYRDGVVFWEGAALLAEREDARLSGNVIVALPFSPTH